MIDMANKKTVDFEASMARLEEIVRTLESGSEGLDASLKLYEEGISLVRLCTDRLERAEQTVKMLQFTADGGAELVDFNGNGENLE